MIIHLLDLKREMVRNGITMLDFLENNFNVDYTDPNLRIIKVFLIKEEHLCRPDLVSADAYGDVNYVDIILKFNQISNPFSMELFDMIVVPDLNTVRKFYQQENLVDSTILADTKSLFIDPTRASKKDLSRLEMLKNIASKSKNGSTEIKPTNLLRTGEVPYTSNGDIIVFAPNSSAPRSKPKKTTENNNAIT